MNAEYTFLAKQVAHNPDGTSTIFGMFDNMELPGPPYDIAPVVYVVGLSILPTELNEAKKLRLEIGYATSNVPIYSEEKEYRTPSLQRWVHHRHSIVWSYSALQLPEPGEYSFRLYIEDDLASTTWLKIWDAKEASNA